MLVRMNTDGSARYTGAGMGVHAFNWRFSFFLLFRPSLDMLFVQADLLVLVSHVELLSVDSRHWYIITPPLPGCVRPQNPLLT